MTLSSITGFESVLHYFTIGDIDGGYGSGNVFWSAELHTPSGPGAIPFGVETGGGIYNLDQYSQEFRVVSNQRGPLQGQAGVFLFYEDVKAYANDYDNHGHHGNGHHHLGTEEQCRGCLRVARIHRDARVEGACRRTFHRRPQDFFGSLHQRDARAHRAPRGGRARIEYQLGCQRHLYRGARRPFVRPPSPPGFRAPSFGAPTSGQAIQLARSENDTSYETGVKAELFDHRARIDFDVYYYDVKHQQLTAAGGLADQTELLNANKTIGKGAELDFEANLTPSLTLNLSGSINDATIDDSSLSVGTCFSCTVTNNTRTAGGQHVCLYRWQPAAAGRQVHRRCVAAL